MQILFVALFVQERIFPEHAIYAFCSLHEPQGHQKLSPSKFMKITNKFSKFHDIPISYKSLYFWRANHFAFQSKQVVKLQLCVGYILLTTGNSKAIDPVETSIYTYVKSHRGFCSISERQ